MPPSSLFTVSDIMTAADDLKRADLIDHAEKLFHEYDVVPFPRNGEIKGFFSQGSTETSELKPEHLLSDATDVLELPRLLTGQPFYFVISGNRITGYVHYSDLNKYVVAIPFFALFRTAERLLWEKIQPRVKENDLLQVFSEKQSRIFVRKRQRAVAGNVDLGWTGIFSFPAILKLARYFGAIQETDEEIEKLRLVRNKIAHSDNEIVNNYDDVQMLADAKEMVSSFVQTLTSRVY
jgi:hypothetical protein